MKTVVRLVAILGMIFFAFGCAITDYDGFPDRQTQSEAKLWGQEISFSGTGTGDDGTYSYTVKYDNRSGQGAVTINSYRNPVVDSFSNDGVVDRDGDDIQGSSGLLGGKFLPYFKAVDTGAGSCEFFDNITFDKSSVGASVALCISGAQEEIDKDLDLQASFSSFDDLFKQIWSGALRGSFTMELTQLVINGNPVNLPAFSISAHATSLRPSRLVVDVGQPSGAALIQAILDNTNHLEPVSLGLVFAGGLSYNLPAGSKVAFNHDRLWAALN